MNFFKLGALFVIFGLISFCGAPGPVSHVDFDTEFADTANVKSTPTEYGILQEKPYKDLVGIQKSYTLEELEIESLDSLAKTDAGPDEKYKKDFSYTFLLDPEAKFQGADKLLNEEVTIISINRPDPKCKKLSIGTSIQGVIITFTVERNYLGGIFYSFEDYKKECVAEAISTLKKLNSDKKLEFSYLHIKKEELALQNKEGINIQSKLLSKTSIKRRLFKVTQEKLQEALITLEADIEKNRVKNKEDALKTGLQEEATASGKVLITLDPKAPELSKLSLTLNASEKLNSNTWKQGVYDPFSGVIQRAFTPLLLLPYEILLHTFLTPLGAKPDENGFYLNSFKFESCRGIYINTLLMGVEIKIDDPITDENQTACFAEIQEFLTTSGRALKFDYIEAL